MSDITRVIIDNQEEHVDLLEAARRMPSSLQLQLNDQFMKELESSYLYLSLVNYFDAVGLKGFSHWMLKQSEEEKEHAMKLFRFMQDRGVEVEMASINAPKKNFSSPVNAVESALMQERSNTLAIKALYAEAMKLGEFDLVARLHWFLEEQVEEEESFMQLLSDLKRCQSDSAALFILDRELIKR